MKRIHQLTAALGMDREAYEEMLVQSWGVSSSTDLTPEQRHMLIGRLTEAATAQGVWHDREKTVVPRASGDAKRRLRYHTLWCAVRRAELPAFVLEDGRRLEGEKLRSWLIEQFDSVRSQPQRKAVTSIPKSILRHLSETFVNPICNRWLSERGSRQWNDKSKFYIDELSSQEVKYLTERWKEFQRVIENESSEVNVPIQDLPHNTTEN